MNKYFNFDPSDLRVCINVNSATILTVRRHRRQSERFINSYLVNFKTTRANNLFSSSTARKFKKAVEILSYLGYKTQVLDTNKPRGTKHRLSFITLTMPTQNGLSDTEIKQQVLQPFLQNLRDKVGLINYVWKAEIQANKTIHFHLTTDLYIHYKLIRYYWNKHLFKTGILADYYIKHGHYKAPSTEIKAVKNVRNIAAYLAAYLAPTDKETSKKQQAEYNERVIKGRLWGISSSINAFEPIRVTAEESYFYKVIDYIKHVRTFFKFDQFFEFSAICYGDFFDLSEVLRLRAAPI